MVPGAQSAILTYHSLDSSGSVISISPAAFRAQMQWLASSGIPVLPLEQAWLQPGSIAITFDDGYANFLGEALPILDAHGFPATVFLSSAFLGKQNSWLDQQPGIPRLEILSRGDARDLVRRGVRFGAHGVHHHNLARLPPSQAHTEIRQSKLQLQDALGCPVTCFAFPFGSSTSALRQMAAGLFDLACGTRLAYVTPREDPMDLPRLDTYYFQNPFWFHRIDTALGRTYTGARGLLRRIRMAALNNGKGPG
jgi:peptidoglycan/xylan/chitin deacetylase (PgdA/CDA1 family)